MNLASESIDNDLSGSTLFPNFDIAPDWVSRLEADPNFRIGQLTESGTAAWVHAPRLQVDVDSYLLDLDQNDSYRIEISVDEPATLSSNRAITIWQGDGRYVDLVMNSSGLSQFDGNVLYSDVFIATTGGRHFAFIQVRNASGQDGPIPYRLNLVKTEDAPGWSIDWRQDGNGAIARLFPDDNSRAPQNFTLIFDAPNATVVEAFAQSTINGRVVSLYSVQQRGDTVTVEAIGFTGLPEITFQGGQGAARLRLIEGTVSSSLTLERVDPDEGYLLPSVYIGTDGSDSLVGSEGADSLYGMDGTDTLIGGAGDDFLFGGDSPADLRDILYGGDGNDNMDGGWGNDELHGGNGNDTITGGFGSDTLIGNAGDDVILGAAGADLIFGGPGNDFINGGFGYDRINGGTGADRFFHAGVADHASDWIQDYNAAEGDVLVFGLAGATRQQFQVNTNFTPSAGAAGVAEAFVIYRPTGQILWALVDGAGQSSINLQLGGQVFDLMA